MKSKNNSKKVRVKSLRQVVNFSATPHEIYEMLMDSKKHAKFTGSKAKISRKIGGISKTFDGWAKTINIELKSDKKIVQKWRGEDWVKDHYSLVTFDLKKIGNKTKLIFTQKNIPIDKYKEMSSGWRDYYWNPIKKMLKK